MIRIWLFLFCFSFIGVVLGRITKGEVDLPPGEETNWVFLDKFCFQASDGKVKLLIEDLNSAALNSKVSRNETPHWFDTEASVALYSDLSSNWGTIEDSSCDEREYYSNKVLPFSLLQRDFILEVYGARPRWWYLAAINCHNNSLGMNFKYTFVFTNGDSHLSFEEFGIFQTAIFFLCLIFLILCSLFYTFFRTIRERKYTRVIALMLFSVSNDLVSKLVLIFHFGRYINQGEGFAGTWELSIFLEMVSHVWILALLWLLSKGWPVSTNRVPHKRSLLLILLVFLISYITTFVLAVLSTDPQDTIYHYDTKAGHVLIVLQMLLYGFLERENGITHHAERNITKQRFYKVLSFFTGIWLLTTPGVVFLSRMVVSWYRLKVLFFIQSLLNAMAFTILSILFLPEVRCGVVLKKGETATFSRNKGLIAPEPDAMANPEPKEDPPPPDVGDLPTKGSSFKRLPKLSNKSPEED